MTANLIVLLTDFGNTDPYVGIMKGVISQIAPDQKIIDLGHEIPPGDIQQGAFQLWQAAGYFPSGTVFLGVIDPGVGTERKGLYFQRDGQVFIGPDNGLFTYLGYKGTTAAWELANTDFQLPEPSATFHGRDIFAPAAAYAARGISGNQFGPSVLNPEQLPRPICKITADQLEGEVISIDRFGNLITSLGQFTLSKKKLELDSWIEDKSLRMKTRPVLMLSKSGRSLPLVRTFAEIPDRSCAALIGSSGLLEIAANGTAAKSLLDTEVGDPIALSFESID